MNLRFPTKKDGNFRFEIIEEYNQKLLKLPERRMIA